MERRVNNRKKEYKKSFEDPRRKREELQVTLRKRDRDLELQKKRQQTLADFSRGGEGLDFKAGEGDPSSLAGGGDGGANAAKLSLENMNSMIAGVMSGDPQQELECTQQFRRLLSIEQSPPIQEVLEANVVAKFVEFLQCHQRTDLQFEAAWALTNIASGTQEQTRVVIDHGAVPIFVRLLSSPKDDVREQAVWALGNIAGDSPACRDLVLQSDGLQPLLRQLQDSAKFSMLRNATWTLSNLCRGKPAPPFDWVSPSLPVLNRLLNAEDTEVLTDACWALSYLSDGNNDRIQAVIDSGVCTRLIYLLLHQSYLVQTPALRTVGNIVTGDDRQTQVVIEHKAIPNLLNLLGSPKKAIRKEACWTISNITAGNKDQIQAVINNAVVAPLVELLKGADFDIKKEAAWAISNAVSGGNAEQVDYLVSSGAIKPLCDLLMVNDMKIVTVALEAIENILRNGKQKQKDNNLSENPYCSLVEQADGITTIESLQDTSSEDIYTKCWRIIYTFFPFEEENNTAANVPSNLSAPAFDFGVEQPSGGFNFQDS